MRSLPRVFALFVAVALLPLLRAFEGDPYEGLEAVASQTEMASRPDPDSVVANREDKARRMFRLRESASGRELSGPDGDDLAPCVFEYDDASAMTLVRALCERGPPESSPPPSRIDRTISARGPPV